jgi:hypothetical protein
MLREILRYVATVKIFQVDMPFISYILRIDKYLYESGVVDSVSAWQGRDAGFEPRWTPKFFSKNVIYA